MIFVILIEIESWVVECIAYNAEFLTIVFENVHNNVIISCIYRQPGSDMKILAHAIEELFKSKTNNICLYGVLNIKLLIYKDNNDNEVFQTCYLV